MPDDMPKRIELMFQDAVDNLRFFKQQQWAITNYAFLIYSALVALAHLTGSKLLPLLYYALVLVWFYNALILVNSLCDIEKFRRRIEWVYDHYFAHRERERLGLGQAKDRWLYGTLLIVASLAAALFAAAAIHALT